ncbi:restriction endonuclease subunit S [Listeria monocytogenes]
MSKKSPQLRFEGFTDDWEERKLSDVANHRGGTAIEKYFDKDGVYKVISIGSYGLNSQYVDQNIRAISNEITDGRVVNSGELTMVLNDKTANGTIIGRTLLVEKDNEYVINQRTEIISPKENFDSNFAYTTLNGPFREKVKRIVQGGTQIYVNYPAVSNLNLELPKIEEQQKIGSFFKQLDDTIALHQRKLDLLKEQKKGYLQKMFPKNGAKVPELRFAGFADDWEQREIGKILEVTSVKRIHQSDWEKDGVPFFRARDIVAKAKGEKIADPIFISKEKYEEFSIISGKVMKGDLIVTGVGTIGIPMLIENDLPLYFKDGNVIWFKNENKFDGNFLYYSFIGNKIQNFIKKASGIGTVGTYTIDSGKKTPLIYPLNKEQKLIGEFLEAIDSTITLHQRKLDLLKEQKKGFLQKMFI